MSARLASRFGKGSPILRSHLPLTDDQIMGVAPSIFALAAHEDRSVRYSYIPTINVLNGLRKQGFQPFMVAQTRVRNQDKVAHTKHMIRMRHAGQINAGEANEIILLNSHDGTSSYQMLSGMLRFVCENGLVCGSNVTDLRVPHKGDVVHRVIDGAFTVLDGFKQVEDSRDSMKALTLSRDEQLAYAEGALALRYEDRPAPIEAERLLTARRWEDRSSDLWVTFQRIQENLTRGGITGRTTTGRLMSTRAITGVTEDIRINRGLWIMAEKLGLALA